MLAAHAPLLPCVSGCCCQTISHPPSLQVGEMTQDPIKTRFGYHIILVEARK